MPFSKFRSNQHILATEDVMASILEAVYLFQHNSILKNDFIRLGTTIAPTVFEGKRKSISKAALQLEQSPIPPFDLQFSEKEMYTTTFLIIVLNRITYLQCKTRQS